MTFEIINGLIEKYFAGETSLEEEQILRGYFSGSDIDVRLRTYAPLFQFFENEKEIAFDGSKIPSEYSVQNSNTSIGITKLETQNPKLKILRGGYFWKIAATVTFLIVGSVAIFKVFEPKTIIGITGITKPTGGAHRITFDETSDPDSAIVEINKALALVSKKMKKGTDQTTDGLMKLKDATSILNKEN